MAGGPIVLNYSANVKDAVAGTNELSKAVEKTADAADDAQTDIASSADKTLSAQKKAAQGIIQATKDAARQQIAEWARAAVEQGQDAETVQRKVSVMYNKIEADAKQASTTVERSSASGWSKAQEAVDGFGGKVGGVLQTASNALGSFDGSISSVGTTISGLATLIPGVGGLIGGALGGIAATMFNAWDDNSKKAAQAVADMYDDMIESGNAFASQDLVNSKVHDIIKDQGQLNDVRSRAAQIGVSVQTALRAEAGDHDALALALGKAQSGYDVLHEKVDTYIKSGAKVPDDLSAQAAAASELATHYQGLAGQESLAAGNADLYRQSISNTTAALGTATGAANALNEKIKSLPTTRDIKVNVTGLDGVAAKLDAITRDRTTFVTVKTRAGDRVF